MSIPALQSRPAWLALKQHHRQLRRVHLRQLFARDPQRGTRFTVEAAGIYFDYSKNRVTDETLQLQGLVGDTVLGVVEVDPRGLDGEARATLRIPGEELPQVDTPQLAVVLLQRQPGWS